MSSKLYCYGDFDFAPNPVLIGTIHWEEGRRKPVCSFRYDETYLERRYGFLLSPDLPISRLEIDSPLDSMFGMLEDAVPDNWGKGLMRSCLLLTDPECRIIPGIRYLLEVPDETRMGALRFSETEGGPFISVDSESVPPITDLRKLEALSRDYEKDNIDDAWLLNLARQGSSLGGARPKASVRDTDGSLLIAKFPSVKDEYDVGALECLAMRLAEKSGITVPRNYGAKRFLGEGHHTFLSARFDRSKDDRRIHTASAMTLSGKKDGDEASILDLIDIIYTYSADMEDDLEEMYRRTLFSYKMNNTDNHLRNHSFILREDGWHLSPLYDVNISPYGNDFALSLDEGIGGWDIDRILDISEYFRIRREDALAMSLEMDGIISSSFEREAGMIGITPSETETFEAFLNI